MAAERDELGSTGPGMSGTGRDQAGMEAGTTRSMAMGDQPGTAEVHSGIAFAPESQQGTRERAAGKVRDVADTVTGAAGNLGERARSVAGNVGEKAGDLASQARSRVSGLADRATTALDDRGMLGKLRENPLPALGVAFAVGFLLAGGGRAGTPGSKTARARSELRNALMAGVTAGLGQGARSFLRNLGAEDSVVNDVMQNLPGLGGSPGGSPRGGGSMGGTSRSASAGRAGTTSRMASTGTHRPPSHQENF
jgi:ElaB/YqjD/DUF883 family membrane-anchored ribosome-binding protein